MDILSEHQEVDLETVRFIHTYKTGAIIRASVRAGALLGDADEASLRTLTLYGEKIGMAFQIVDDILDVEGNTEQLGKKVGADGKLEKATYPHVAGMESSKNTARQLIDDATRLLESFGSRAFPLKGIADLILKRKK
jgi:geranylgeranyl diphosphate synthase type II